MVWDRGWIIFIAASLMEVGYVGPGALVRAKEGQLVDTRESCRLGANRGQSSAPGESSGRGVPNPLFIRLIEEGFAVDEAGKVRVKLPRPTMPDGLSETEQQKILIQVAGPRPLEEFVRNTVVAPVAMNIQEVSIPGWADPLHRVDVGYVAYGTLDQLFTEAFFQQLLHQLGGSKRKSRYPVGHRILSAQELARRKISLPPDTEKRKYRYFFSSVALFDRVLLRTTRQVVAGRGEDSLVVAAAIDPVFRNDPQYPNQWQPIRVDDWGGITIGAARAYLASASYTKVTRLKKPQGALFIEHHHLFAEPKDWFGGKNFLRSKLPLAVQEAVRQLRWQLRAAPAPSAKPLP